MKYNTGSKEQKKKKSLISIRKTIWWMGLILLKSDRQFKITKMEFNKDQSKDNVLGKKTYSGGSGYSAVLGKKICRWR